MQQTLLCKELHVPPPYSTRRNAVRASVRVRVPLRRPPTAAFTGCHTDGSGLLQYSTVWHNYRLVQRAEQFAIMRRKPIEAIQRTPILN